MDDKIPEMTCPVCHRPFKERRTWQKYCSRECRMKGWQMKKVEKVLEKVREGFLK